MSPVGDDILATAVLPGYLVLIEARQVDGFLVADNPEVVAVVVRSWPSEDGRFWEISWVGAVPAWVTAIPGHDPRLGVALYEPKGTVTVLGRDVDYPDLVEVA